MAYINPSPGVSGSQVTLVVASTDAAGNISPTGGNLGVPALQNVTVNNGTDVFTWSQLDAGAKKQITTTSTNSLEMTVVVDPLAFFGNGSATADTAERLGLFGLSKAKERVKFDLFIGKDGAGANIFVSGYGYLTNLAPTVSAEQPVWTTPVTIAVDGDFTVGNAAVISSDS